MSHSRPLQRLIRSSDLINQSIHQAPGSGKPTELILGVSPSTVEPISIVRLRSLKGASLCRMPLMNTIFSLDTFSLPSISFFYFLVKDRERLPKMYSVNRTAGILKQGLPLERVQTGYGIDYMTDDSNILRPIERALAYLLHHHHGLMRNNPSIATLNGSPHSRLMSLRLKGRARQS